MIALCPEFYPLLGDCAYIPLFSTCNFDMHEDDEDDEDEFSLSETVGAVFGVFILVICVAAVLIFLYRRYFSMMTIPEHAYDLVEPATDTNQP